MNKQSAFNSFLLATLLAVTGWVAKKTADNGEHLAAMQVALNAAREAMSKAEHIVDESLARLEHKLDDAVPRREFDARVQVVEAEQRKADLRLREIDLEIIKLKQNL